jgi:phosphatidylserine/phosphatidylglycerophosphate/cardiolipin synthase-like enzyme
MWRINPVVDNPLSRLAEEVRLHRDSIYRIWIVSPWLAMTTEGVDPLLSMADSLKRRRVSISIITLRPVHLWHADALRTFRRQAPAIVYLCPDLHAKVYLVFAEGYRYALLGSPNLTGRADRVNREIAVEFRTTSESREDQVGAMISFLTAYAEELALDRNSDLQTDTL